MTFCGPSQENQRHQSLSQSGRHSANFHIFGKANLNGQPLDMYKHTWERMIDGFPYLDVKYIYLQTDVDVIMERMTSRARQAETNISRMYLSELHKRHDEFIKEQHVSCVIDGNRDESDVWDSIWSQMKIWVQDTKTSTACTHSSCVKNA